MMTVMKVRCVPLAFVGSVLLAALVANSGSAFASDSLAVAAKAYAALKNGNSTEAISLYTQSIDSHDMAPEALANALLNRALAFQKAGQNTPAIDDYTTALRMDMMAPALRATAFHNRGIAQQGSGKLPQAIEDFTSALLLDPTLAQAFLMRANALRDSGQYLFALSDYDRAIKNRHPDTARVYVNEAQTFALLKRPDEQRQSLQAALAVDANYQPAKDALALLGTATSTVASAETTGSVAPIGASTIVKKIDYPQGIEPDASLTSPVPTTVAAPDTAEKPVYRKVKKEFADRILPETANPKRVTVASVPAIPKPGEAAVTGDETMTATITPVADTPIKTEKESVAANTTAPASGWAVQIASATTEDAAWTTWKNMQKTHKILGDRKPVVVKADLGSKGTFYRVRLTGYDDQSQAKSACSKLKSGGVSCYISKAEG